MFPFEFKVIRSKKRRRTTAITVSASKGVVVHAPHWIPDSDIVRFLTQKQAWIVKHLNDISKIIPVSKEYVHGEKHLYFGEEYPLVIKPSPHVVRPKVELVYGQIVASVSSLLPPHKQKHQVQDSLLSWYLKNGQRIITQKVDYYAKKLGVTYNRITIKRVSSIWGSCSSKNNLNFNRKLIMAPHPVVDYVVVHEVCHLVHRHHKPSFWKLVATLDPDYKHHLRWLKKNSHLLSI